MNPISWFVLGSLALLIPAQAESNEPTTNEASDRVVTAPLNKTPHYGNLNGVKIAIPPKYWASVQVQNSGDSDLCKDTSLPGEFNCPISSISLSLRYPSFEPIYNNQDLLDWGSNFMRPFDKQSSGNHWISMGYRADLFKSTQGNLGALYRSHIEEAVKHFGQLSCDSKYELEHCATEKGDGPLLPNEFFFDNKAAQTLIECTRLALPYGNYLGCHHYFVVSKIKAVAEMGANSEEQISMWKSLNTAAQHIATKLIVK